MQDVGTARLGQGADEVDVADVAGRLLPAAFRQIGNHGIEHGLLIAFGHKPGRKRDRVRHTGTIPAAKVCACGS